MKNVSHLTNPLDSPIKRQNKVNDPQFENTQGYTKFEMPFDVNQTMRFAEVQPILAMETVSGDRILAKISDRTFAEQLNSTLMSPVNMHYDAFAVPLKAIYPNNWAKIITNPLKGDDIPDQALPAFPLYWYLRQYLRPDSVVNITLIVDGVETPIVYEDLLDLDFATDAEFSFVINQILRVAFITSKGSLLDSLGYSFGTTKKFSNTNKELLLKSEVNNIIDYANSRLLSRLAEDIVSKKLIVQGVFYTTNSTSASNTTELNEPAPYTMTPQPDGNYSLSSVRQLLYDAFQHGYYINLTFNGAEAIDFALYEEYIKFMDEVLTVGQLPTEINEYTPNLSRVAAYQMIAAEFYTADGIDNIFSSELYMQNIRAILYPSIGGTSTEPTFDYNGVSTEYDYFTIGGIVSAFSQPHEKPFRLIQFASAFFAPRQSLVYRDFLASARTNPLAVGDLSVKVSNGTVSAVDITEKLVLQRFLNAVNRTKNKLADYMAGIFGIRPAIEDPAPLYITHAQRALGSSKVINTSENQGAITSNIDDSSVAFNVDAYFDDNFIFIVNRYVEALVSYPNYTDLQYSNVDRFSMFNPLLQHVGDEALPVTSFRPELRQINGSTTFGYTARYSAYKFSVSRTQGGFVDNIPSFVMTIPQEYLANFTHITPEFIRARQSLFDRFYPSLTGVSPSQYFHFIVSTNIDLTAIRKMQALPPVLF